MAKDLSGLTRYLDSGGIAMIAKYDAAHASKFTGIHAAMIAKAKCPAFIYYMLEPYDSNGPYLTVTIGEESVFFREWDGDFVEIRDEAMRELHLTREDLRGARAYTNFAMPNCGLESTGEFERLREQIIGGKYRVANVFKAAAAGTPFPVSKGVIVRRIS